VVETWFGPWVKSALLVIMAEDPAVASVFGAEPPPRVLAVMDNGRASKSGAKVMPRAVLSEGSTPNATGHECLLPFAVRVAPGSWTPILPPTGRTCREPGCH
jgi:hypothetical protein